MAPNGPVPVIIGSVLAGSGIDMAAMSAMPSVPMAMAVGGALDGAAEITLREPDEVHHLVPHGVHGVMRFVAVESPIARRVGHEIHRADRAHRHVDGGLRPLRALRHPAAVGATHREVMPCRWIGWLVMVRLPILMRTRSPSPTGRIDAREHPGIEGPHVELGHLGDVGERGAGVEVVGAHDEAEVAVDAAEPGSVGCTTNMPIMPIAICTISSEWGWYMKVPLRFSTNS